MPRVDGEPALEGLWQPAEGARALVLLAHGAGQPMDSEFMDAAAGALVERGLSCLRFDYAYSTRARRERKRRPPERAPALLAAQRVALEFARTRAGGLPLWCAGKSMGGRMSTMLAAEGVAMAGLVLYGYPLHPAKKPEKLRVEHWPKIRVPALFLAGTRDALSDLALLREHLPSLGGPVELHVVEGGDHSFKLPKRLGREPAEVHAELADRAAECIERWPS